MGRVIKGCQSGRNRFQIFYIVSIEVTFPPDILLLLYVFIILQKCTGFSVAKRKRYTLKDTHFTHSNINVKSFAFIYSTVVNATICRKRKVFSVFISMNAQVQNSVILIEYTLCSITMVYIKIYY